MNIKNNKRYKTSSEKIETAFLALTLNHKYEDISISQICEQANINRSTFYTHYDDINDLIIKIESKFANSMSTIFDYGSRANNEAFIEMFKFVKDNKYFYKAFLNIPYITSAEKNTKNTTASLRLSRKKVWVSKIFAVVIKKTVPSSLRSVVMNNCAMISTGNFFNRHR